MMRPVWSPRAKADLARIDDFNAIRDRNFADEIGRAAIAAGRFLAEFPGAGAVIDGIERKWRIPRTDFILIYRVTETHVEILRAYNGRENWRRPKA